MRPLNDISQVLINRVIRKVAGIPKAKASRRHALLKSELEVAPVYLKKPRRAAGLIHAAYLAMTVDALSNVRSVKA